MLAPIPPLHLLLVACTLPRTSPSSFLVTPRLQATAKRSISAFCILLLQSSTRKCSFILYFGLSFTIPAYTCPRRKPQAVAYAIKCAAQSNIKVSARSGGHSYAAFGLGGHNGALVVDLSALKKITLDSATGYAVSQTGNRLGDLATSIYSQGKRALPHGTCPYVSYTSLFAISCRG